MRILLVDDDNRFADALCVALRRQCFDVSRAATGAAALAAPAADLVLLDMGLPDMDGVEVCRKLRSAGDVAIIAVTARGKERDRVIGLRSGADDYLVKPFGVAELRARIDAVMRRVRPAIRPVVTAGPIRIDVARHTATTADGLPVTLTRKEFELLAALARQPGLVVSRERLLLEVWDSVWPGAHRTLDVHIATLRAQLGDAKVVQTIRGVGYRLVTDGGKGDAAVSALVTDGGKGDAAVSATAGDRTSPPPDANTSPIGPGDGPGDLPFGGPR